jgi:hypothetical protein
LFVRKHWKTILAVAAVIYLLSSYSDIKRGSSTDGQAPGTIADVAPAVGRGVAWSSFFLMRGTKRFVLTGRV